MLHHNFTQCVCTGHTSVGHSPAVSLGSLVPNSTDRQRDVQLNKYSQKLAM